MRPMFVVLTLLLARLFGRAQVAVSATQTEIVEGHVLCNDGNVPARSADVRLIPITNLLPESDTAGTTNQPSPETTTDFDGYYMLSSVVPGTYLVDVRKDGYSDDLGFIRIVIDRLTRDQRKALLLTFPQVLVRASGVAREDAMLRRAGAITGHVTVDIGGTIDRNYVTVTLVSSSLLGNPEGNDDQKATGFSQRGLIDDRGIYRITGLPVGKYRLSVRVSEAYFDIKMDGSNTTVQPQRTGTGALTIFAPDVFTESEAKLVEVHDGEEVSDADLSIPRRKLHSTGGIVTQGGAQVAGATISVQPQGHEPLGNTAVSTASGNYRFDLLPPGVYFVEAKYPNPFLSPAHSASRKITVQLNESDMLDANVDIPTQGHAP
ncbi:collagen binding domain-containing protein [Granulicella sp. S190]|uniref:MSCRAMM family protein n=1 Tax=Granulicella sp. S190 TaxID=1747226 RepID=UPI00131C6FE9|nr:carboxypeptidase-like regulatory domain-containing protein [Granulicella sp. S190]